jgi:hypothetical protein
LAVSIPFLLKTSVGFATDSEDPLICIRIKLLANKESKLRR